MAAEEKKCIMGKGRSWKTTAIIQAKGDGSLGLGDNGVKKRWDFGR